MSTFDINEIKRHNLNRLLTEKNIKAVELSRLMGVSASYISRLRSGSVKIGDKTLDKLSQTLNVDVREFYEKHETTATGEVVTDKDAKYEAEHHRLILRFINKKWSLDTNRLLLEIEKLGPYQCEAIFNLLEGFLASGKKTALIKKHNRRKENRDDRPS